jgi:hypothetical protein
MARSPYADPEYWSLRPLEQQYCRELPEAQREDFQLFSFHAKAYFYGSGVSGKPFRLNQCLIVLMLVERKIIERWENVSEPLREQALAWATRTRSSLLAAESTPQRLRKSDGDAHLYVHTIAALAPPTRGDSDHINSILRGIWTFEKTLFEQAERFQNIIHLYAKVDDAGNLVEVRKFYPLRWTLSN